MANQYISKVKVHISRDKFSEQLVYDDLNLQPAPPKSSFFSKAAVRYLIIFLLMLFSAAFSVWMLMHQSLRLDESQSLWQASQNPISLLKTVGEDVHVPLYHLILHYWQIFLGNSVPVARSLSLIFFLLTIPAVYMLGKAAYGYKVGLLGALLVSFSPFLNWYGSETRMYSMLLFFCVLNQYFFVKIFSDKPEYRKKTGAWIGYFITGLLGIFVHYFFWLSLFAQILFYLSYRKSFPKGSFFKFFSIVLFYALAMMPWVYFVFKLGFASGTKPHLIKPNSFDLFNTFSQFIFGFQTDHINTLIVSLWPVSVLLAFFALRKDRRSAERRKIPPLSAYFLMAAFVPIFSAFVISITVVPVYLSRYLIFSVPSLYLFLIWVLSANYPPKLSFSMKLLLFALMFLTLVNQTVSAATPVKEDYRAVVDYLQSNAKAQDVIIVAAPFTIYPVEYYYKGPAQIDTLPIWDRYAGGMPAFEESKLPGEVKQLETGHRIAWVVLSYDQGYNDVIKLYFETHFKRLYKQTFSSGLTLYAYQIRY